MSGFPLFHTLIGALSLNAGGGGIVGMLPPDWCMQEV